jgi:hypothetical protein
MIALSQMLTSKIPSEMVFSKIDAKVRTRNLWGWKWRTGRD